MTKKKKKVLFVATVDSHIELFHLPYLKMFHDKGWEVHVATETGKKIQYCDKKIKLPIKRSPFKLVSNYKAVRRLRQVMKKEGYSIVHCHTPMGGVVARLAGKKCRRDGTRMIYTAHGFHFYTGAPLHYWLMFYPVEWYLAKYTDTLITINNEDYKRAQAKFGRRCRDIQYVPGVGVDEKKFERKMSASEKRKLRESLGLRDEDKVLICVGRLDKNKNQGFLIKAMPELLEHDDKYHLLLVGPDELNGKYQKLAEKLGVSDNVHFLGYRDDIPELMQISDVAVSSSKREGLPVNLIEAAMVGLPIVTTDCRGNRDICEKAGGVAVECDAKTFSKVIERVMQKYCSRRMKLSGIKEMSFAIIEKRMSEIYYRKKRVLHLLASNKFSGAENVACMIIRNLSNEYEMAYCSPRGDIEKKLNEMNIKYYPIDKLNYKFVKKATKDFNPDVIHAHDFRASLVANKFGKKMSIISHVHQDQPKVRKMSVESLSYKIASRKFLKIIWASEAALNNYYYKDHVYNKSIVLRNVVDRNYILQKANEYEVNEEYDVIFLGRLEKVKNPLRALKILKLVKQQKEDIRMAIVGDGEERESVERFIHDEGLSKNVKMYGFLDNPYPVLNKSKVLLITSEREGTPMSILEAQALNKPIICTKINGFEKIIANDKNNVMSDDDIFLVDMILEALKRSVGKKNVSKISLGEITKYNNEIRNAYVINDLE